MKEFAVDRVMTDIRHPGHFLAGIERYAADYLGDGEMQTFAPFARFFFSRYPLEELHGRHLSDVFGMVYHAWRLSGEFDRLDPKIRLFNPNLEEQGWLCPHTVLMV